MTMHKINPADKRPAEATDRARRAFLKNTAAIGAAGAMAVLAGCSAPASGKDEIDPSSLVFPPPPAPPRFHYERTIWGSNDVAELTSTDRFKQFATGQSKRGKGLAKPFGVAAHAGRVYISDTVSRQVHLFDFPNGKYLELGRRGVGQLSKPLGMAISADQRLYVVDGTAKRVVISDLDGNFLTAVGKGDHFDRPTDVAVSPDAKRIYVLDTGGVRSKNHRVVVFDSNGKVVDTIGQRGSQPGEFNLPLACTTDRAGNLYVLDTGNFRCQVFSPDGTLTNTFGKAGRYPGQFGHPKGIAVDNEGIIYISDTSFGVIQMFDPQGRVLMSIGRRSERPYPAEFLLVAGVAVDVDRRVYAIDQFFRKVDVFRAAAVPETTPMGAAVDVKLMA